MSVNTSTSLDGFKSIRDSISKDQENSIHIHKKLDFMEEGVRSLQQKIQMLTQENQRLTNVIQRNVNSSQLLIFTKIAQREKVSEFFTSLNINDTE